MFFFFMKFNYNLFGIYLCRWRWGCRHWSDLPCFIYLLHYMYITYNLHYVRAGTEICFMRINAIFKRWWRKSIQISFSLKSLQTLFLFASSSWSPININQFNSAFISSRFQWRFVMRWRRSRVRELVTVILSPDGGQRRRGNLCETGLT